MLELLATSGPPVKAPSAPPRNGSSASPTRIGVPYSCRKAFQTRAQASAPGSQRAAPESSKPAWMYRPVAASNTAAPASTPNRVSRAERWRSQDA
ncbi:hypothetical protein ACFQ0M_43940 [Kitasatospora aburaviensis]